MEEKNQHIIEIAPSTNPKVSSETSKSTSSKMKLGGIIAGIAILGILIFAVVFLLQPGTPTDKIRDIFIIFMALESILIGVVLVVLVVQIAILINLLQTEIKPILNSTNETVNNLKGTASFLSDHLVEPVIKLNEYLAGIKRLFDLFRPGK
jgi:hypothetical protein